MKSLKMVPVKIIWLIFLFLVPASIQGQIAVNSISVEGGWYIPQMSFWNNDSFVKHWENQFSGDLYGRVSLEINIIKTISSRIGVGYWSQARNRENITWGTETRTDELQLTLIPFTMDLIAYLDVKEIKPFTFYGGIGWGINFVQMKYTRTPSVSAPIIDESSGQDYLGYLLLGIDIPIASGLGTGVEFRYLFAEYQQQLYDANNLVKNYDVSLAGPQITLAIKYYLNNK